MTDYSGLVERLRSPIVSFEDNGSRRYQGLATEAAAAIESLAAQVDGENRFSVWANNPRTVALMKRCAEYERQVNELREAARTALKEKS